MVHERVLEIMQMNGSRSKKKIALLFAGRARVKFVCIPNEKLMKASFVVLISP